MSISFQSNTAIACFNTNTFTHEQLMRIFGALSDDNNCHCYNKLYRLTEIIEHEHASHEIRH